MTEICLGIESTAHTFGIGIVNSDGRILANVKDMYIPKLGWGIHPKEAAEHHEKVKDKVLASALKKPGLRMEDIDLIAFSQGPGLPPCLYRGLNLAKELSEKHEKPVIGSNHCISHIASGLLATKLKDPVTLYVSGGNTQVISFIEGRYRVFGETSDIGLGNALDKFGRDIGLPFPAGPRIEKEAKGGAYQELPYTVKGMDLSFSGIITEAVRRVRKGESKRDICFSLQETLFAMATEVTERALAHARKDEVLLTGGVAANKRLQEMLGTMCRERGARFAAVPRELAADNGAMIAWTGLIMHRAGLATKKIEILPRQRTDDVEVRWL